MQTIRKWIAAALCALCVFACAALPAGAADEPGAAQLYNLYGDDMLFAQNNPIVFAGAVTRGLHVTGQLLDDAGKTVAKAETYANKSNRFALQFPALKGGYTQYTAVLQIEGTEFARLERILVGELWMASGQSNMEYPLGQSAKGLEMQSRGESGNPHLRILHVPSYVEYMGDAERFPAQPQRDIPGALWYTGSSPMVWGMSAVAYFFADTLQQALHMPVGILNCALGGSSIYSWLGFDAIQGDDAVKQDLIALDRFTDADDWKETGHNVYLDMTTNYNKKVQALAVFRPQGLLWYQGETDLLSDCSDDAYARAFDLLQRSWSRLFGRGADDLLPILYSGLAPYHYGDGKLPARTAAFGRIQQQRPDSRAYLPIYDLPLTFLPAVGSIHPQTKAPIGMRMADAALHMVYGKAGSAYTAAVPQKALIRDGGILVTFAHTGDGLTFAGDAAQGFSVCGRDGIYVQADAELAAPDTLRIFAPEVPDPVSAAYAYAENNTTANLFSTENGERKLPASPFVTDPSVGKLLWQGRDYLSFDFPQIWHFNTEKATGFYPAWQPENAQAKYTADAVRGNALQLTAERPQFSVRSCSTFLDGAAKRAFHDSEPDYSRYEKITFFVRNDSAKDITLRSVRLHASRLCWFAPDANGSGVCVTIPADGKLHEITLDLNTLFLRGKECGATYSRRFLRNLTQIELCFEGRAGDRVTIDEMRLTPNGEKGARVRFIPRFDRIQTPFDYLRCAAMWLLSPLSK